MEGEKLIRQHGAMKLWVQEYPYQTVYVLSGRRGREEAILAVFLPTPGYVEEGLIWVPPQMPPEVTIMRIVAHLSEIIPMLNDWQSRKRKGKKMAAITPGTAQEALAAWDAGETLIAVALPFKRVDFIYGVAMEIIRRMPEFNQMLIQAQMTKFAALSKELGEKMKLTASELEMAKAIAWRALTQGWAASVQEFGSEGTIEIKKA